MKTIALIGSCGYIGSAIFDNLSSDKNIKLKCYDSTDNDIYPPHNKILASNISQEEINTFDIIIYVAGLSRKEDCEFIDYNTTSILNIYEPIALAKKMNKSQVFIYSSTASLYTSNNSNISDENMILDNSLWGNYENTMYEREQSLYSLTNTNTIGLRFGTVIGLSRHMRNELLHIGMFNSAITTGKIQVWNPDARRSILWVKDLFNILKLLIDNREILKNNIIFNVSSFNTTIYETAACIKKKIEADLIIRNNTTTSLGFYTSTEKISNTFNYKFIGTNDIIIDDLLKNKEIIIENIKNPIGKYIKCLICNSILLKPLLDMGYQPLANKFEIFPEYTEMFPLVLNRCERCFHTQLNYFVDREVLFKNYIYESGTSTTLRNYFSDFADIYTLKMNNRDIKNVLEIACNDGFQLDEFKKRGWNTYGVDPARNIVDKAIAKGHNIQCGFWGKDKININVRFDLIIAENVLAHVNNPIDFLSTCVNFMNDSTLLVIQTSQANIFQNCEFDTIYHEHISFFTIKSMKKAVERVGCFIENIYKPSIHGTSYVFEIRKGINNIILPLLIEEEDIGMYTDLFYKNYEKTVKNIKVNAINYLKMYKDNGYTIIAYGAAAKGTTFLNYIFDSKGDSPYIPQCIIDDSKLKHNTYMPGGNIVVKDISEIKKYSNKKIVILVTAWNFFDEIYSRISNYIKDNSINIESACIRFYPTILEMNI